MFYIEMYDEIKEWVRIVVYPDLKEAKELSREGKILSPNAEFRVVNSLGVVVYTTIKGQQNEK